MPRIELTPPLHPLQPLNTGNSTEMGATPKQVIDALNEMTAELYGAMSSVEALTASAVAVAVDRPFRLPAYTVATAPDPAPAGAGAMIFVSDGAVGLPIVAFSDGAAWLRCDTGAQISNV